MRAHSDLPATLAELLPMSLLPKDEDRDGALEGIARLQMVYNLNTTYIENGMGDDVKLLNYKDMLALGKYIAAFKCFHKKSTFQQSYLTETVNSDWNEIGIALLYEPLQQTRKRLKFCKEGQSTIMSKSSLFNKIK